jgi:hypothetical protein
VRAPDRPAERELISAHASLRRATAPTAASPASSMAALAGSGTGCGEAEAVAGVGQRVVDCRSTVTRNSPCPWRTEWRRRPPVNGPQAKVRLRPKVPTISLPFRNTDSEAREPSPRLEKSSVKSTGCADGEAEAVG